MEYFRRTLLVETLTIDTLKDLLNKPMGRFYLGYLSITLSANQDETVKNNLVLIRQYI